MMLEKMSIRVYSRKVFLFCCTDLYSAVGWPLEIELKDTELPMLVRVNRKDARGRQMMR
jgi:hypothetical protein